MNTKLALVTAAVLLPAFASAEETAAPKAGGYQLKNRSSFAAGEETRAPFWPIGWSPKVGQASPAAPSAPVVVKAAIDPNSIKITSILLGSPSLAVINGRAYGEGEYLKNARPADAAAAADPASSPKIRVQQITDSGVVLTCGQEVVSVKFTRPGLALKARPANPLADR